MAATAYSQYFKRELDVSQLLAMMSGAKEPLTEWPEGGISDQWREWIKSDVVCSSCGNASALIVTPSKSKSTGAAIRQAHFRFQSEAGQDAHDPLCEFYGDKTGAVGQPDQLVDFGNAKSAETALIRGLVCKGIAHAFFAQSDIRSMRQFFFDLKAQNQRVVTASRDRLEFVLSMRAHNPNYLPLPFHPSFADLPGFDWTQAIRYEFFLKHEELIRETRQVSSEATIRSRAAVLIDRYAGNAVFDALVLRPYYEKALSMCMYIGTFGGLGVPRAKVHNYRWKGAPAPLLAFCALLLHISDWNVESAIARFSNIAKAPAPADQTLGNVIGLNPFLDFLAWEAVFVVEKIASDYPDMSYPHELAVVEQDMREQYRVWKLQG